MINVDRNCVEKPTITNSHRTEAILKALGTIFYNKCYLCEKKMHSVTLFEVDHFIPVNENIGLKYEWSNLHLCCKECNGSRVKTTPKGGYLDPCKDVDDVENEIIYDLPFYSFDMPTFVAASANPTDKVKNSITQLLRMHYGSTPVMKTKRAAFREVIAKRATMLVTKIAEKRKASNDGNHVLVAQKEIEIQEMIKKEAPFTMLMRSIYDKLG